MPTVVELKDQAKKLGIKKYSTMKKPDLERAIDAECRRLENIKLDKIRQAKVARPAGPDYSLSMEQLADEADFSKYDDVEIPVTVVKGKGIDNMARVRNYCNQPVGRDHLTPRMARRLRKRSNRGDMTVPLSLLFPGPSVNAAMGVA